MATYGYTKSYASLREDQLRDECVAAGLPVTDVQRLGDDAQTIYVITSRDLTPAEQSSLAALVAAHDGRPRRKRTVLAILTDVAALSAAQQALVWADLSGGSPAKLTQDAGPNAASVFVMQFLGAAVSGLTNAEKNEGRRRAAAFYCQDNPGYLVHPAFDPTINVPGDEPYTP